MTKETENDLVFSESEIREILLDRIEPDKKQFRKEFNQNELDALAESIKTNGLKYPILVTAGENGKYKIVDGERRWRAYKQLAESNEKFSSIRAIFEKDESQLLGILGNMIRTAYNPLETAAAITLIKKLLGKNTTDDEVAKYIGKSRITVVEYQSLLKLPQKIQDNARVDSRVPYNKLKSLAASKGTNEEKIAEYEELYKKYPAKNTDSKLKKKDGKFKPSSSRETRTVVSVRKKLDTMKDSLNRVQFTDKVDGQEKENFLKSLREIIETAQSVQQKLSS